jgi:hypothetical protein
MARQQDLEYSGIFVELLRRIVAQPDDDNPRLEFAREWERRRVDGYDPDRARFIRLQVHLAEIGDEHPEWFRLAAEADRLRVAKQPEWVPLWFVEADVRDPEFDRGFVESITVNCSALRNPNFLGQLLSTAPIRHFNLVAARDEDQVLDAIRTLVEFSGRERILSLRIDGQNLTDKTPQFLADSRLINLQWLSLAYNEIGIEGTRALATGARGGRLPSLFYVNLLGNPIDPTEQVLEDQGVVVSSFMPPFDIPDVPWLRKPVRFGRALQPNRFGARRQQFRGDQ